MNSPLAQTDRELCVALLPVVSRTFALSIELLPPELRTAVRTAYLLCRIVDSIEDDAELCAHDRARLFAAFDRSLSHDRRSAEPLECLFRHLLHGVPLGELQLCHQAGAVLRSLWSLPPSQQRAIVPHVLTMSAGMREFSSRQAGPQGLRLADLGDLERYCYFVAGTVGELLTELFLDTVAVQDAQVRAVLAARAVPFGLGLQLVNIIKDVAEDHHRGVCFVPAALAAEQGLELDELLSPAARPRALRVLQRLCAHARVHLDAAREYTIAWPWPAGQPVRLFCTVPLALALMTLSEVEHGADALRAGRSPKVSRAAVAQLLQDAPSAVSDDGALRRLFDRCASAPRPAQASPAALGL